MVRQNLRKFCDIFENIYLKYETISRKIGKFYILLILNKFWQIIRNIFTKIFGNFEEVMEK